jgi:UPF0716 protein FxsA
MTAVILLAFILVPILEIGLFIQIGGAIGLVPTLLVVIGTALLGTTLLRWQGLTTLHRAEASLQKGDLPVNEVVGGVFLLVAGALLLTPGFFTDAIGFSLFAPPVRRYLGQKILGYFANRGSLNVFSSSWSPQDDVIEGDFEIRGDREAPPPHPNRRRPP